MLSYFAGLLAGMSGCVLPVLAALFSARSTVARVRFVLSFFIVQAAVLTVVSFSFLAAGKVLANIQPVLLLFASLLTFVLAYKRDIIPAAGGLYGLSLAPCTVGYTVVTAVSAQSIIGAVMNALLFSAGMVTPLLVFAVALRGRGDLNKLDRISSVALVLVSYYLAYLAGSSWRWVP